MRSTPQYISAGVNRSSSCAACSSQGLLAFGAGKYVALWDTEDVERPGIQKTLRGHKGQVTSVKLVDEDEEARFISGDTEGEVRIWSNGPEGYTSSSTVPAHPGSTISALGVSPAASSSRLLFTGGSNASVKVWRLSSDQVEEVQKIDLKGKLPLDLEAGYLPGSEALILVLACTDRRIQVWTNTYGKASRIPLHPSANADVTQFTHSITLEGHEDWVRCLSLSPYPSSDGASQDLMLASGSQDNYIRLWRISAVAKHAPNAAVENSEDALDMLDEFERKLAGEAGGSVQISTKAHVLSSGTGDSSVRYNVTLEALLIGHEAGLTNIHWSPPSPGQSPILLSTASDNSLVIWSPSSLGIWVPLHRFGALGGRGLAFYGAIWGKEGKSVLAGGWNGGWEKWTNVDQRDAGGSGRWEVRPGLTGHHGEVQSIAWNPKGDYLASVSSDQTTRIHAACRSSEAGPSTWAEIARPQIHGYDMTDIAWVSPLRIASTADEKVARVFDAPGGFVESLASLGVTGDAAAMDSASRPKGATVPPLGLSNRALGREAAEMDLPATRVPNQAHDSVSRTLTALPTEEELATSTLWPEIEKVYGHGYELFAIAASHDGAMIASACKASNPEHAVVRVHSTSTWDAIGEPLAGHTLTITRISFSKDDSRILTCSRDRGWRLFRRIGAGKGYEVEAKDERAHARMVLDCAWSHSGDFFVTASRDKTVKVWAVSPNDEKTWSAVSAIKLAEAATAVDLLKVSGQDYLAVGTESGKISVYSVSLGPEPTLLHEVDPRQVHRQHVLSFADALQAFSCVTCQSCGLEACSRRVDVIAAREL